MLNSVLLKNMLPKLKRLSVMAAVWLMKPSVWLCGKCWFVLQEEKPANKENEAKTLDKPQGKSSLIWGNI